MSYINEILFDWRQVITAFVAILTFIDLFYIVKPKESSKWKKTKIFFAVLFIFGGVITILYTNLLVKVPNIINKTYADAKNILVNAELDFNTLRGYEDGIVKTQSISEESIVVKGTLIELGVEGVSKENVKFTKSEIVEQLRQDGYRFIKTNLTLYERKMRIVDEQGVVLQCLGTEIDYTNVNSVIFKNQEYNIEFDDYAVIPQYSFLSDACVVMNEELPVGNYSVEIKVDGYDTFSAESNFTADNMGTETEKNINIYMIPQLDTQEYTYRVSLVDENFEPLNYYCYQIKFEENPYFTYQFELENRDCFFVKSILGTEFIVTLKDNQNHEYECIVRFDEVTNEIYLVKTEYGTLYQADYIDYLNTVSR